MSIIEDAVDLLINYIKNNSEDYFVEANNYKQRGVFMFTYRNLSELIHATRHSPIFATLTNLQQATEENINNCIKVVEMYDINTQFVVDITVLKDNNTEHNITTTINRNDNIISPKDTKTFIDKTEYEKMNSQYIDLMSNISKCDQCHKFVKNIPKCAKCKIALYCNVKCQKLDWPIHKNICNQLKQ